MGACGYGSFENDAAMDWTQDLIDADDAGPVLVTLRDLAERDEYLEVDECAAAICAAEVVAALRGKPSAQLPEELVEWLPDKKLPGKQASRLATRAVKRVLKESEIQELFEDSPHYDDWKATLADLLQRLR